MNGTPGATSVGTLAASDVDVGETFTYTIVGGADASLFSVGGAGSDELILTNGILDFETKPSYSVTVRVTDAGGLTYDETLTVTVNDLLVSIDGNERLAGDTWSIQRAAQRKGSLVFQDVRLECLSSTLIPVPHAADLSGVGRADGHALG